jgi:O-methyltransferase involved in polyketide biosynthesis
MITMMNVQFDNYTSQFINQHPESTVVHLGCGLDSRVIRVGRERVFEKIDSIQVIYPS